MSSGGGSWPTAKNRTPGIRARIDRDRRYGEKVFAHGGVDRSERLFVGARKVDHDLLVAHMDLGAEVVMLAHDAVVLEIIA